MRTAGSSARMVALPNGNVFLEWISTSNISPWGIRIAVFDEDGTVIHGTGDGQRIVNWDVNFDGFGESGYLANLLETDPIVDGAPVQYKLLRYGPDGKAIGGAFLLDTVTQPAWGWSFDQDADGGFRIGWVETGTKIVTYSQDFDGDAQAQGAPQTVTIKPNGAASSARPQPDGTFLDFETIRDLNGDGTGAFLQRYDAAGKSLDAPLQVNEQTEGDQSAAGVFDVGAGMQALIFRDTATGEFRGRILAPDGAFYGASFQIDVPEGETLSGLRTLPLSDGTFIVAWFVDSGNDGTRAEAQRFGPTGEALGGVVQVSGPKETVVGSEPYLARFDMIEQADGEVMIHWQTFIASGERVGPFKAQRLEIDPVDQPAVILVDGGRDVGQTLTAQVTLPDGSHPDAVTWQWTRDGADIAGATGATYALTLADGSATVGVRAMFGDAGDPQIAVRGSIGTVGNERLDQIQISGRAEVGRTLTLLTEDGAVSAEADIQWLRNGIAIDGATGHSLTLTSDDWNAQINVSIGVGSQGRGTVGATAVVANPLVQLTSVDLVSARDIPMYPPRDVLYFPSLSPGDDGGYHFAWGAAGWYQWANGFSFASDGNQEGTRVYLGGGNGNGPTIQPILVQMSEGDRLGVSLDVESERWEEGLGGRVEYQVTLRDFAADAEHDAVDDYTYGSTDVVARAQGTYGASSPVSRSIDGLDLVPLSGGTDAALIWHTRDNFADQSTLALLLNSDRDTILTFGAETPLVTGRPRLTALDDGGFVAIWQGRGAGAADDGIHLRRFAADAGLIGGAVDVSAGRTGTQALADLTLLSSGTLAIVWQEKGPDGSWDVIVQRTDLDGATIGEITRISDRDARHQVEPVIAATDDGGFAVGWREMADTDDPMRLQVQRFDAEGRPTSSTMPGTAGPDDSAVVGRHYAPDRAGTPDILVLDSGDILLTWEAGAEVLLERFSSSSVADRDAANLIRGGATADDLWGGGGNDTMHGAAGDDTLDGGPGADWMIGGDGSDLFYVDSPGDRISESRNWAGQDHVKSSVDYRAGRAHIEDITLTGNDGIRGVGNGLRNTITGNGGNNILDGGKNVDTLIGGAGNDIFHLRTPGDTAIEVAGGGIDTARTFGSFALPDHVEHLHLQTMRTLDGTPVSGLNAIGNALDNTIVGNPFDNVLVGREGSDTLKGQAGADTFVFDRAIGTDVDRIVDFNANERSEGDTLKVKGAVFGNLSAGILSADLFVAGTAAKDAEDRFVFDQASGSLWFDTDGAEGQDQILFATFDQGARVTAEDILVF